MPEERVPVRFHSRNSNTSEIKRILLTSPIVIPALGLISDLADKNPGQIVNNLLYERTPLKSTCQIALKQTSILYMRLVFPIGDEIDNIRLQFKKYDVSRNTQGIPIQF